MPKPSGAPVRHLWILRHAKAASDAPWGGSDRERPLTARGRRDATALGRRLASDTPLPGLEGVRKPDLAICSAAVRTRQTADLVIEAMGGRIPLDSYRSLYDADIDTVLRYLREVDEGVKSTLLVGHNPTMFRVVLELVEWRRRRRRRVRGARLSHLCARGGRARRRCLGGPRARTRGCCSGSSGRRTERRRGRRPAGSVSDRAEDGGVALPAATAEADRRGAATPSLEFEERGRARHGFPTCRRDARARSPLR